MTTTYSHSHSYNDNCRAHVCVCAHNVQNTQGEREERRGEERPRTRTHHTVAPVCDADATWGLDARSSSTPILGELVHQECRRSGAPTPGPCPSSQPPCSPPPRSRSCSSVYSPIRA